MVISMKLKYIVTKECIVKEYMKELNLSKRFCKKVKLYGKILINGVESKNYYPLKINDELVLEYNEEMNDNIAICDNLLNIKYEDENILIIEKPISLASQPSHLHFENNVVSMVKKYFVDKGIDSNVHVVNRLDYQTSGLMAIAKNGYTHHALTKEKIINRKYYCIVEGLLDKKEGTINKGIKREMEGSIKRIVCDDGFPSITHYKVIKENNNRSLIDVKLDTGRTHQIRVHFKYLGHPLVGDKLYGKEDIRLFLHCYNLSFKNPLNGLDINIESVPDFYKEF